ncbi:hypothetical protein DBV05_g2588 [Lasiodiplodia theobromae]|uniref:DUF7730 domain-containing protein n=1 Tax=Lasiodiplodia theobromae TaxID=45133 RepID=A0A5N5DLF0_9PEZI|nr:hypothetical protein DBV05_g2588 [Lasiodiplodia theobromae]
MASKRQRYLYRPLYRGVIRPLGYCLLTPLVLVLVAVDICRECCCASARDRGTYYRSPLEAQREFEELCERLEKDYTPRPLLAEERPRPLTSCGGDGNDGDEKTEKSSAALPQDQSPFFTKLPAELRLRIYHEILGGKVIHLLLQPGRVGHVVCSGDSSIVRTAGDPDRRCIAAYMAPRERQLHQQQLDRQNLAANVAELPHRPHSCPAPLLVDDSVYRVYSTHHRAHDSHPRLLSNPTCSMHRPHSLLPSSLLPRHHSHLSSGLAFLLTCRRAYREAVDVLYAANVFDANHPQTLVLFARTLLPHRLAAIRELQVRWSWRLRERANARAPHLWWEQLWRDVVGGGRMSGLRAVWLSLELGSRFVGSGHGGDEEEDEAALAEEEGLLMPVADCLRGLKKFEVAVELESLHGALRCDAHRPSDLRNRLQGIVCAPPGKSQELRASVTC